jgi:hypothetical protein
MKKLIILFVKGIAFGLGLGLCLAGALGLLYRALHGAEVNAHITRAMIYFFIVGTVMGTLGGWCLGLQMILVNLLSALFMKILELVPLPVSEVGADWGKKIEIFFEEVLKPMPGIFRKFVEFFLVVRVEDYARVNRAIARAKQKEPLQKFSPQWASLVVLHYFLEPLWIIFYIVYAILFLITCVIWSFPFF